MKPTVQSHPPAPGTSARSWLWVDGVGGFLVCGGPTCTIGQPVGEGVDIAILADISSRHAVIHYHSDGYVLEPLRPTLVDGLPSQGPAVLGRRATIELGSVRLDYCRPHPYSTSARLEIVSKHGTSPSCDGILLAGDSLVLGPGQQAHVRSSNRSGELVLYREQGRWLVRGREPLEIDGVLSDAGGPLGRGSRVVGPDISFTFEEAG